MISYLFALDWSKNNLFGNQASDLSLNTGGDVSPENSGNLKRESYGGFDGPRGKNWTIKRSKFSEEQIVHAIRQAESGTAGDFCLQLGVSDATFYAVSCDASVSWRKNGQLKRLVAVLSLGKHMRSEALRKKSRARPPSRTSRVASQDGSGEFPSDLSVTQCRRAFWYCRSRAKDRTALRLRIHDLAHAGLRLGYLQIWVLLRREGWRVNRERIKWVYRLEGLQPRMQV